MHLACASCCVVNSEPIPDPLFASSIFQSTQQYLSEHNIQQAVETAINATIKVKPANPFAFMVRDFACRLRPRPTFFST
jgi:hypothetical protein